MITNDTQRAVILKPNAKPSDIGPCLLFIAACGIVAFQWGATCA